LVIENRMHINQRMLSANIRWLLTYIWIAASYTLQPLTPRIIMLHYLLLNSWLILQPPPYTAVTESCVLRRKVCDLN